MTSAKRTIALFDVDGTLTAPRQVILPEIMAYMMELKKRVTIGLVGGSDLVKILEQMGGEEALPKFDYLFSENGLVAHKSGQLIGKMNILEHMGEEKLQELINFALGYMARLKLPAKRGTFVEFRSGMLNLCPVGRSCSQAERDQFAKFDQEHGVRETFVQALREQFSGSGLIFAIGGQISIDVFPEGWDKRYCLRYLEKDFETIHFFGDKTSVGGNDYEIFEDPRTIGHTVTDPEDTVRQLSEIFPS